MTSVEIHAIIQELYFPKDVENLTEMVGNTYQYLVALNNKGYNAHEVKLSKRVTMTTLDNAIRYKNLYFLEIIIKDNILSYSFWKYPRKTQGETLHTLTKPFKRRHLKYLKKLEILAKKLNCKIKDPV